MQGTDLTNADLLGADLSNAQLQGANLSQAYLAYTEFNETFVFRTIIDHENLAAALIQNVHANQVREDDRGEINSLSPADVNSWIAAAAQFSAEKGKEAIRKRFGRLNLDPPLATAQDAADMAKWSKLTEQSLTSDPDGARHRGWLAAFLGNLACEEDDAPYVAYGLVKNGRLAALGDQKEGVRTRLKAGREKPNACKGVAGFTEEDWRALDAIKPTAAAPRQ